MKLNWSEKFTLGKGDQGYLMGVQLCWEVFYKGKIFEYSLWLAVLQRNLLDPRKVQINGSFSYEIWATCFHVKEENFSFSNEGKYFNHKDIGILFFLITLRNPIFFLRYCELPLLVELLFPSMIRIS